MSAVKLLYTNKITSSATLTASSEATGYDVENVYEPNYSITWRSTAAGATAQTIVCDFGAATAVDCIALGNINFRSTATVKIQGHTADSWGTPDVDETITVTHLNGYRRTIYHDLGANYSKRYWRITVTDNGNPDGFIEIGHWALGSKVTLDDNFDSNHTKTLVRNSVTQQTEFNQVYVYDRDWQWTFDFSWTNANENTRDALELLHHTVKGNFQPFYLVVDDTSPADAYYVRLVNDYVETRIHYDVYSMRVTFVEEAPGLVVPR